MMLDDLRQMVRAHLTIPAPLRANHRALGADKQWVLPAALTTHFFADRTLFPDPGYVSSTAGSKDVWAHLSGRLQGAREQYVPWLDTLRPLAGARIIEIGCGTGGSTVALAEQGATVLGLDVHQGSLEVARVRAHVYGLGDAVEFRCEDAAQMDGRAAAFRPDMVIFFAALEHMTASERLDGLRAAWRVLSPGGHLVVLEAPNRLWHTDLHTAHAPFFEWLPDDLAMRYARYTDRVLFKDAFPTIDGAHRERLARWGRGVSFHEFVVAFEQSYDQLPVIDSLDEHLDRCLPLRRHKPRPYQRMLRQLAPALHRGFTDPYLNIALRHD